MLSNKTHASPLTKELSSFSKVHQNHVFLDGDNFLWTGSVKMYDQIFGKLLAEMANKIDDPSLYKIASNVYLKTLHLSDRERIDIWRSTIIDLGLTCAYDSDKFIEKTRDYNNDDRSLLGYFNKICLLTTVLSIHNIC